MNKFTDFSDQVTFVSSQITGRDFSRKNKGNGNNENNGGKNNNNNKNMFNSDWFKKLSFDQQQAVIAAIQNNNGANTAYKNYQNAQANLDKYTQSWQNKIDNDSNYKSAVSNRNAYVEQYRSKLRDDSDYISKQKEIDDYRKSWKPSRDIKRIENDEGYKALLDQRKNLESSWEDKLFLDKKFKTLDAKVRKATPKIENDEEYRRLKRSFENAGSAWDTALNTEELQNTIANLKLGEEKHKQEKRQETREYGGALRKFFGKNIENISNSKFGQEEKLPEFHGRNWKQEVIKFDKGQALPPGAYQGEDKKWYVDRKKDSIVSYLAENGDQFANAAGKYVTSAAKTTGSALYKITGGKDSEKTKDLRKSSSDLESEKANKIANITDKYQGNQRKIDKKVKKVEDKYKTKLDTLEKKISDQEKQDKFDHAKKVAGVIGTGATLAKTAVSSKARENEIRKGGVEGLQQKQAKLMYLLGDRSDDVRIALGKTEGMGLGAKLKSKYFQHKINKSNRRYQESLNAQFAPQFQLVQNQLPKVSGFSVEQTSALNDILSKDFGEEVGELEGLNLSWQPEEYTKLNAILETDFETLDAQIAESQDMSEREAEKVSKEQVEDSQSGEIDVSDTIDYNNLDPETMTALVDKSYYEAPEEEKQYQEMIAKGFAEKESSYNNFLESMSEFVDQSY